MFFLRPPKAPEGCRRPPKAPEGPFERNFKNDNPSERYGRPDSKKAVFLEKSSFWCSFCATSTRIVTSAPGEIFQRDDTKSSDLERELQLQRKLVDVYTDGRHRKLQISSVSSNCKENLSTSTQMTTPKAPDLERELQLQRKICRHPRR